MTNTNTNTDLYFILFPNDDSDRAGWMNLATGDLCWNKLENKFGRDAIDEAIAAGSGWGDCEDDLETSWRNYSGTERSSMNLNTGIVTRYSLED
jgi:hypothetical protein|tara:strand:+ start:16094 stop:16375 length:282 start_codon:yes stop_codon:yes gene_type:complete